MGYFKIHIICKTVFLNKRNTVFGCFESYIIFFISKCWFERNNELTSLSSCNFKALKGFQLPHSLFQKGLAYKTVWLVKHRPQLFQTNDAVNNRLIILNVNITNTVISVAVIENCNRFSHAKSANIFQQKQKNHYRRFVFLVPKSDLLMKSLTLQYYE